MSHESDIVLHPIKSFKDHMAKVQRKLKKAVTPKKIRVPDYKRRMANAMPGPVKDLLRKQKQDDIARRRAEKDSRNKYPMREGLKTYEEFKMSVIEEWATLVKKPEPVPVPPPEVPKPEEPKGEPQK